MENIKCNNVLLKHLVNKTALQASEGGSMGQCIRQSDWLGILLEYFTPDGSLAL
jgi:hypothetical protein